MKRRPSLELLDIDAGSAREIAGTIRDLQMFNQYFGGTSTTERLVRAALGAHPGRGATMLEVAAGNGYVPAEVRKRLASRVDLQITLLDRSRRHLNGNGRGVIADALALPFTENAFDLVSCNLFAHHLEAEELRSFAREALRVCRVAFLINDLVRGPVHLALAYAGFPLYRSPMTRNDAPASVRQAYTPDEMREILEPCGAARITISRHYLCRMGIVVWKAV